MTADLAGVWLITTVYLVWGTVWVEAFPNTTKMAAADVSGSVALIGCRSIQLHPEAFWSVPVDNTKWKSERL